MLFLLDYGAGNVQSLANTITRLGHPFQWINEPADFAKATCLIFPGVGAFESAVSKLHHKGLFEPLRAYILSGRPYFGICIGLQILCQSSTEAPASCLGLGLIRCDIEKFDVQDKSVPHIGWNSAEPLDIGQGGLIDRSSYYYFVHSYCLKYAPGVHSDIMHQWAYAATQYGKELFISAVHHDNIFATQFHPEKSGPAGLALIDEWIKNPNARRSTETKAPPVLRTPASQHNLTRRVVACMDVRTNDDGDLVVTKGDQYHVREKVDPQQAKSAGAVRNLGKPVALAKKYYDAGADELCLLNITSFRHSPLRDQPMLTVVAAAAETIFVPLTIGGGIKDTIDPDGTKRSALEVASAYFRKGADKVSIGSEAVYSVEKLLANGGKKDGTSAIETIAHAYGSQAVVVSIDPRRVYIDDPAAYSGPYIHELVFGSANSEKNIEHGKAWWYQCTVSGGRESRPLSVVQLAKGVETLGAGEILVNSIDRDGTGLGFDLDLIKLIKNVVKIPVIASSGAGSSQHFLDVFRGTEVEAALAAGIFHRGEVSIPDLKLEMKKSGINTRLSGL